MSDNTFRIFGIDLFDVLPDIIANICCGVLFVIVILLAIWVLLNVEEWMTKKD